jgi:hypothetical protein
MSADDMNINTEVLMRTLILAMMVLLSACGGGNVSDDAIVDGRVYIGPPDCANHPELCR